MSTPSNPIEELREQTTKVVDAHTQEWKAGHNHLIVDQLISLFHKALEAKLSDIYSYLPSYEQTGEAVKNSDVETLYGFIESLDTKIAWEIGELSTPKTEETDQERSDHHRRAYYQKERRGKSYPTGI